MAVPEFVANPLGAIRERFEAAVAGAGGRAPDPDSDWGVASHFRRQLTSEAAISSVSPTWAAREEGSRCQACSVAMADWMREERGRGGTRRGNGGSHGDSEERLGGRQWATRPPFFCVRLLSPRCPGTLPGCLPAFK